MWYASSSLNYINCVSRDVTNFLESTSNATSLFIGDGGGSSTAHFFYNGEHSAENPIKKEEKDTVRSVMLIRTSALILCLYYESWIPWENANLWKLTIWKHIEIDLYCLDSSCII